MNPRYELYLRTKPETPGNVDYMAWISARWAEWRALSGVREGITLSKEQHDAFDAWLAEVVAGQVTA